MDVLLKALPGHRIGRQQITSPHRHLDNGTLVLNRLSKLKKHLLEKMSIVCWLGSIPHTSGKVVNFNTCIIFFWFFLPQMIHYMTVNQEPGFEWSPMPLHMHTSIAQPGPPPPAPSCTGYKRFVCAELCSAPDVRDDSIQRLASPKHILEILNGGKMGGKEQKEFVSMPP